MENRLKNVDKVETIQIVLPEHLNHMGNMHGGEILKLMDNTAGIMFIRCAGGDAVTAAAQDIQFIKPIHAKSLVKCTAEISHIGTTSVTVQVCVFVEDVRTLVSSKAAQGTFIGVAVDEEGKPRPIR